MGHMRIYRTDGTTYDEDCDDVFEGQSPMYNRLKEIVDGDVEYVHVLYDGEPKYMVVNEIGAVMDPPLPINKEASHIYHAATMRRENISKESAFSDMPKIHGDAVVLYDCELI